MTHEATLIIQFPRGGAVDRQLHGDPPAAVAAGDIALDPRDADSGGHLEPPEEGEVVLSVPSPEALRREADEVRRVVDRAGTGTEPLVVVVTAADELRDDELAAVLDAARHARRGVILCVLGDG
jgi:hypothetical protein